MTEVHPSPPVPSVRTTRAATLSIAALVGCTFFAAALTPSMMPRSPIMQGAISGVAAAIGFQIGELVPSFWAFMGLRGLPGRWHRAVQVLLLAAAAAIGVYALWNAAGWQNATRSVLGLDPVDTSEPITILLVALIAFVFVLVIFRLFAFAFHGLSRLLSMLLPPRVSLVLGGFLLVWATWAFVEGVIGDFVVRVADSAYQVADSFIDPDLPEPTAPFTTGSAASLVKWPEMGVWGRAFVSEAPTQAEIAEFTGGPAMDPIRVYVGLRAAPTPRQRAELALEELKRVGGFERSVLMIVVPTGTGWMDPGAQDTLDFMLGGDVATVVSQYSYLPSALSLLANAQVGVDQARAIFDVIYSYWTTLPKDARPRLYIHGLSLGAFNIQVALPLIDLLADPMNGALWTGSPFFSPLWQRVRTGRQADSPVWQPRYGNGSLVRVMNQKGLSDVTPAPWGPMRLVFLEYGSDPIGAFAFESSYRRPEWTNQPHASDVSADLNWFPIVTMLQVALDTSFSLNVPGYGHYYIAPHYIDAWAELLDPPGWNDEKSRELKAIFAERPFPL